MVYASMGLLAALIHIIINQDVFLRGGSGKEIPAHSSYRSFLFAVLAYFITDALWGILEQAKLIALLYADTAVYFAVMALAVLLWTRYVIAYLNEQNGFASVLSYIGWIFLIWNCLVILFNFFIPILFRFDETGAYHAEWGRYTVFILQFLLFLVTFGYMFLVSRSAKGAARRRHLTISLFGLVMSVFVALQILLPMHPIYSVAYLLGTCLLHTFVVEDEKDEYRREQASLIAKSRKQEEDLGAARQMVYTDPLTRVKSKHAYVEKEYDLDRRIEAKELKAFAVVVFDVNNLKTVNDTLGHEEGDRVICAASRIICRRFQHSPVYRIGGDEFVALLEGEDFANRVALVEAFDREIEENLRKGEVVVSKGMYTFDPEADNSYRMMFEQADKRMYARKSLLKDMAAGRILPPQQDEKFRFSDETLRTIEASPIPFAVYQFIDRRVVTLALSAGFLSLFGYTDKDRAYREMDEDMYKDTHPDDAARISEAADRFAMEGGRYETVYRSRNGEGGYRIIHAMGEHVFTSGGVRLAQVWYMDEGPFPQESPDRLPEPDRSLEQALRRENLPGDTGV